MIKQLSEVTIVPGIPSLNNFQVPAKLPDSADLQSVSLLS